MKTFDRAHTKGYNLDEKSLNSIKTDLFSCHPCLLVSLVESTFRGPFCLSVRLLSKLKKKI